MEGSHLGSTTRNGVPFYPGLFGQKLGETGGGRVRDHVMWQIQTSDALETAKIETEELVDGILWESLFVLEPGC